ncbi:ABC transporter ATP-binding protein [Rubrobacter aplysinae]|uniref:ABC transporter ATP-binding protein n=1 Tax=Rubrobacter aplysinae TaxID=909625 RepID=UPI00064C1B55|nr:ABC transporter ATP-binding protein [Rubrobacter aplysinae]
MSLLELAGVCKSFGALAATNEVGFSVGAGERVAIIGPNGAGKTTLFNLISGELTPDSGTIKLGDRDITRWSPEKVAAAGLGRTFQRNSLFAESTVYENVRLSVQRKVGGGLRMLRSVERYRRLREETEEVLERVGLDERAGVVADELSYGEQRQLELGMALATDPEVLLLDEPAAGMSSAETGEMVEMLGGLPQEIALVLVEHDMDVVAALAGRIVVLNFGEVIADGTPEEVRQRPEVLAAYLGAPEETPDA